MNQPVFTISKIAKMPGLPTWDSDQKHHANRCQQQNSALISPKH